MIGFFALVTYCRMFIGLCCIARLYWNIFTQHLIPYNFIALLGFTLVQKKSPATAELSSKLGISIVD